MVTPGLYQHYKKNNYRVLFVARWYDGSLGVGEPFKPDIDGVVSIACVHGIDGETVWVFPGSSDHALFEARWSSNTTEVVHDERVVIYVALYGDGRVSARTEREFEDTVCLDGGIVAPRFMRFGD